MSDLTYQDGSYKTPQDRIAALEKRCAELQSFNTELAKSKGLMDLTSLLKPTMDDLNGALESINRIAPHKLDLANWRTALGFIQGARQRLEGICKP